MHSHKQIAGTLFIVYSVLQLLGLFILSFFVSVIARYILDEADVDEQWVIMWLLPFARAVAWIAVLVFSLPGLIAGIGLLKQKSWALTLALVLACFKLFSFPFGTGLAVYTFWIFAEDRKQRSHSESKPLPS